MELASPLESPSSSSCASGGPSPLLLGCCRVCRKNIEVGEKHHFCDTCSQPVCEDCSSYSDIRDGEVSVPHFYPLLHPSGWQFGVCFFRGDKKEKVRRGNQMSNGDDDRKGMRKFSSSARGFTKPKFGTERKGRNSEVMWRTTEERSLIKLSEMSREEVDKQNENESEEVQDEKKEAGEANNYISSSTREMSLRFSHIPSHTIIPGKEIITRGSRGEGKRHVSLLFLSIHSCNENLWLYNWCIDLQLPLIFPLLTIVFLSNLPHTSPIFPHTLPHTHT